MSSQRLEYEVKVKNVLRKGTKNIKRENRIRFQKSKCSCPNIDLRKERRYLVMVKDGGEEPYKLEGNAFITEWPGQGSIKKLLKNFKKTFNKGNYCT